MSILEGQYLDGRQPIAVPARMDFAGPEATLIAGQTTMRYPVNRLVVSPRIGRADRFITLPDGGQFKCGDQVFLDTLRQESPAEGVVAWLEDRWGIALAAVVIIICIALVGYFFGLPAAAERIADRIPMETEQALGRQSLAWLDKSGWFKPTNLDPNRRKDITDGFDRLLIDLPIKNLCALEFRAAPAFGPNAFALPGGTIVITDDMVKVAESSEEVLAVLAHEIGHVQLRHTMRSVLQNSAVAVLAATITSDAASLSVAVAGLPVLVARTKYSRDFETAADEYAFRLLKQKGLSPEAFASLMEKLSNSRKDAEPMFAYVSTHPVTAARIQRARAAAQK